MRADGQQGLRRTNPELEMANNKSAGPAGPLAASSVDSPAGPAPASRPLPPVWQPPVLKMLPMEDDDVDAKMPQTLEDMPVLGEGPSS
jgi:hypothetical protein